MKKIDLFLRRVITNDALAIISILVAAIICNAITFWFPMVLLGGLVWQLGAFWIWIIFPFIVLTAPTVYAVYIFMSFEFMQDNSKALKAFKTLSAAILAFLVSGYLLWRSLGLAFRNL